MQAKRFLLSFVLVFSASVALATPIIDAVTHGQAEVTTTATHVQVNQQSSHAIVSWQSFNIGPTESIHFQQPPNGITLNRIDPTHGASDIAGRLSATGKIILVNPAGIHFQSSAHVDVAGLIATTANISDRHFLAGQYHFENNSDYHGSVTNAGKINAAEHGFVAFIAPHVENTGEITAHLSQITEFSSSQFTLQFGHNDLIHFAIDDKSMKQAINENHFIPNNDKVAVHVTAAKNVLDKAIHMPDGHEAHSAYLQDGKIILSADHEAPSKTTTNTHMGSDIIASSNNSTPAFERAISPASEASDSDFVIVENESRPPQFSNLYSPTLPQAFDTDWIVLDSQTAYVTAYSSDEEISPIDHTAESPDLAGTLLSMSLESLAKYMAESDFSTGSLTKNSVTPTEYPRLTIDTLADTMHIQSQLDSPVSAAITPLSDTDDYHYACNLSDGYDSELDEFITPRADKLFKVKITRPLFTISPSTSVSKNNFYPVYFSQNKLADSIIQPVVLLKKSAVNMMLPTALMPVMTVNLEKQMAVVPMNNLTKPKFSIEAILHKKYFAKNFLTSTHIFSFSEHDLYLMMTPLASEFWTEHFQKKFDLLNQKI